MREICDQRVRWNLLFFLLLDKSKIAISSISIDNQCFSDDGMQREREIKRERGRERKGGRKRERECKRGKER